MTGRHCPVAGCPVGSGRTSTDGVGVDVRAGGQGGRRGFWWPPPPLKSETAQQHMSYSLTAGARHLK